jgi:hypothetical protein
MKKLYLFFLLLVCQNAFPDSFIIKKDGTKAVIKGNSFRVDSMEKTIYYKLIDQEGEVKMKFKDFDYVIFGVNKFKTFKLDNSNEISGFFVLAETAEKSLISISFSEQDEESSRISYVFHVIDSQNSIIESHEFSNQNNQKAANARGEIYGKIKFYFSGCEALLNRLAYFDRNNLGTDNTLILGFFKSPVYVGCL